ncbi:hypothetical protein RUM44_008370 [Polyplax serrata]|uniref:Uncharacterized protein n=1 Tax=Polyplax serrata TaxID=468196 RepID=A0ABR1B8A6_POLSC
MAKANVILLNSILWNLREITKLADEIKKLCGDVDCSSWRYPLISCSDLEILKLLQNNKNLDNYTYILELTYDRLLYVFNLIIKYMESYDSLEKFRPEKNVRRPKTLSLASLLCMMWDRIKAQMEGANATLSVTQETKKKEYYDADIEIKISKSTTCTQSEVCSISVCSCCEMFQEFVTHLVLEMEKVLERLGEESAISNERQSMKKSLVEMTNWSAMSRWLEAITKDFNAITERSEQEVVSSRKLRNRIDTDERKMKLKVDQYEEEIKNLETKLRDQETKLKAVAEEKDHLCKEKNQLRDEINQKKAQITNTKLNYNMKIGELKKNYEAKLLKKVEKRTKKELEKEKEWKKKLESQVQKTVQAECEKEKLVAAMAKIEEEKQVEQMNRSEEKLGLETRCSDLETEVQLLKEENSNLTHTLSQKQSIIDDYSKRLMEAFPQLTDTSKATYRASGNPEIDMENQIEANNIRLDLLNEENERLKKALSKIKSLKG